jgi:hypothetical protein
MFLRYLFLASCQSGLLCRMFDMLDIITKNYIFKLTLLRQVPVLICVCLVQVCQTAGPQFTCGSFGFFGSHHVKLLS